jgi:hypothetical protein
MKGNFQTESCQIQWRMFRKNTEHLQGSMFGTVDTLLGKTQKKAYLESRERWFYELVFKRIDEKLFAPLYSDGKSRPNALINGMVCALIIQSYNRWSYEFLMRQVRFDLLTRATLGLTSLDEVPFCEATLFNFQNKLLEYEVSAGIHLIEQVFDGLTAEQLATLRIKTPTCSAAIRSRSNPISEHTQGSSYS